MNKLEEYRDVEADKQLTDYCEPNNHCYNCGCGDRESGFKDGFDAAIALDLPVKFADWKYLSTTMLGNDFYSAGEYLCTFNGTMDVLYKYWIENIYQIE